MIRSRTAVSLPLALLLLASPCWAQQEISKVNGSVVAQAGRQYGDLDTVNGSVTIEAGATVEDAETVNGSIRAENDIAAASLSTVNGSIRVGERARVRGGVETVNGAIFVDRGGSVGGGVSTVNGAIGLVDVDVGGNVETVNGDVTVGVGSHVKGGLTVRKPSSNWFPVQVNKRKPRIVVGPDAVIEGPLRFEREVQLFIHASARTGEITGASATRYETPTAPRD